MKGFDKGVVFPECSVNLCDASKSFDHTPLLPKSVDCQSHASPAVLTQIRGNQFYNL